MKIPENEIKKLTLKEKLDAYHRLLEENSTITAVHIMKLFFSN